VTTDCHKITIRRATPDDAVSIVAVLQGIVVEKVYSAINCPFTLVQEREYLKSLSAREGVFHAETAEQQVVGFLSLDQWTKLFRSMDHVAQCGTFVLREWRGRGIGVSLRATASFLPLPTADRNRCMSRWARRSVF